MPHVPCLAIGFMGGHEWILILLVVVLFFGKRIPGVARSLGSGISEFKTGLREGSEKAKLDAEQSADAKPRVEDGAEESRSGTQSKVESGP